MMFSSRSFKITKIGTSRKPITGFLLVANGNLSRTSNNFRDIATKFQKLPFYAVFLTRLVYGPLGVFPYELP